MKDKFDCIVVGAGPAGCAAAYHLAKAGLNVLVLERGEYPGSKSVSGALLYTHELQKLFPDCWEEAPLERPVTNWKLTFLTPDSSFSLDFKDDRFANPPFNGFTILRSKFDGWLAQKAEEAGALIMTGTLVEDILRDKERVIGVRTGQVDGEVLADVVIIAEGANALLAQKSGLRKDISSRDMSLGVKEIIKIPKETINERFNLRDFHGVSHYFIGSFTNGIPGGGFLYTNKESLSLGMVCNLSQAANQKLKISEMLDQFKTHPHVQAFLEGGVVKEYSSHLIPEGGYNAIAGLYSAGLLVAGEGASLNFNNGFILRGLDYAMASGVAAARTVVQAKVRRDFSKKGLAIYQEELEKSFILRDMKRFRSNTEVLANPMIYSVYPQLLCGFGRGMFTVNGEERKRAWSLLNEVRRQEGSRVGMGRMIRDVLRIGFRI